MGPHLAQGVGAAGGLEDSVAERGQGGTQEAPDRALVVDDEDTEAVELTLHPCRGGRLR